MRPIIVLGFGRSGTTWLADMISRIVGSLILFEPLHPSVTERSLDWSYRRVCGEYVARHLREVLAKSCRKPWLLRNHVPTPLGETSPLLLDYLWEKCSIAGFKEIRLNFAIPSLIEHDLGSVFFVMRDPHDVVTSILNRPNFWEFGGLTRIFDMIMYNVGGVPVNGRYKRASDVERIAILWALTHAIALRDCADYEIPVLYYEQMQKDPLDVASRILELCQIEPRPIHPSCVLSPSQTTMRSFNNLYDGTTNRTWRTLTDAERVTITEIAHDYGVHYPAELELVA
jgi:hypothetical protein